MGLSGIELWDLWHDSEPGETSKPIHQRDSYDDPVIWMKTQPVMVTAEVPVKVANIPTKLATYDLYMSKGGDVVDAWQQGPEDGSYMGGASPMGMIPGDSMPPSGPSGKPSPAGPVVGAAAAAAEGILPELVKQGSRFGVGFFADSILGKVFDGETGNLVVSQNGRVLCSWAIRKTHDIAMDLWNRRPVRGVSVVVRTSKGAGRGHYVMVRGAHGEVDPQPRRDENSGNPYGPEVSDQPFDGDWPNDVSGQANSKGIF